MFIDKVQVLVRAGNGGNGAVSFRHEKFIDRGGPDGGDGGNGGSVIVRASRNQNTLAKFRYQKLIQAEPGQAGSKRNKHGKNGKDLYIDLPVGTIITDQESTVVVDLMSDNQEHVLAAGGKGGFGNAHFVSSTRQAPRVAEQGEEVEQQTFLFELKMIADVGLVGLPNAGKSTLLSVISNARPAIADYPFTTLTPNLGVVDIADQESLLFADIPGLIEGASEGKGLGDEFLRHIERTKVLLHLIDIYEPDLEEAYQTIDKELRSYKIDLSKKPRIVVLNKIEGLEERIVDEAIERLKKVTPKNMIITAVSAASGQRLDALLFQIAALVRKQVKKVSTSKKDTSLEVIRLPDTQKTWSVLKTDEDFTVSGQKIEQFARKTDFHNPHGIQRLRDIMRKMGIMHELERQGIKHDQKITIGSKSIKY